MLDTSKAIILMIIIIHIGLQGDFPCIDRLIITLSPLSLSQLLHLSQLSRRLQCGWQRAERGGWKTVQRGLSGITHVWRMSDCAVSVKAAMFSLVITSKRKADGFVAEAAGDQQSSNFMTTKILILFSKDWSSKYPKCFHKISLHISITCLQKNESFSRYSCTVIFFKCLTTMCCANV